MDHSTFCRSMPQHVSSPYFYECKEMIRRVGYMAGDLVITFIMFLGLFYSEL
jgi:hypothetical protein